MGKHFRKYEQNRYCAIRWKVIRWHELFSKLLFFTIFSALNKTAYFWTWRIHRNHNLYSSHSQPPVLIERFVLSVSTIYSLTYTITRQKNIKNQWAQNMLHAHAVYGMHMRNAFSMDRSTTFNWKLNIERKAIATW